jgi:hypothetical protein
VLCKIGRPAGGSSFDAAFACDGEMAALVPTYVPTPGTVVIAQGPYLSRFSDFASSSLMCGANNPDTEVTIHRGDVRRGKAPGMSTVPGTLVRNGEGSEWAVSGYLLAST